MSERLALYRTLSELSGSAAWDQWLINSTTDPQLAARRLVQRVEPRCSLQAAHKRVKKLEADPGKCRRFRTPLTVFRVAADVFEERVSRGA